MNISDVMIHIDQSLNMEEKFALEEKLRTSPGVIAPRFNPGQAHLLVVAFDPDQVRAMDLLTRVREQGCKAQLVGA